MKYLFSLFALIVLMESCNSSQESIERTNIKKSNKVQNTLLGSYIITQIGENKSISPKLNISIDDKSNKISGFSGCNGFFGTYTLQDNNIAFSNISSSKKFCEKDINLVERNFINALNKVNSFTVKDTILTFLENDTKLISAKKILNPEKITSTSKNDVIKDNYNSSAVSYQTSTRGSFVYINITETQLSYSTDSRLMKFSHYNYDLKDWQDLSVLVENVDKERFQKLKAPTDKRLYDGAPLATLAIKTGDIEIKTPTFDHGFPPKEIEALVNKVLSIKESVVKQ